MSSSHKALPEAGPQQRQPARQEHWRTHLPQHDTNGAEDKKIEFLIVALAVCLKVDRTFQNKVLVNNRAVGY